MGSPAEKQMTRILLTIRYENPSSLVIQAQRFLPYLSWLETQSIDDIAETKESSPASATGRNDLSQLVHLALAPAAKNLKAFRLRG